VETHDAAVIVDRLNAYFEAMTSLVVSHGGHVNKLIGDAILAVFSDDDDQDSRHHALRAVRCGMAMIGREDSVFKVSIGIHTGPTVVGFVGSSDHMEYTVLGDAVGLASRLQSMNKETKTDLLLSSATYEQLEGAVTCQMIGAFPLRGRSIPLHLYTPIAQTRDAEHPTLRDAGQTT
jgi:adenylate cyclase